MTPKIEAWFGRLDKRRFLGLATDPVFLFVLSACLSLGWLILFHSALNYYWNGDDLHLVRTFTNQELLQTFGGSWDRDGLETPAWRPFTVILNHLRARVLGERPAAHRLVLLVLNAVLLWLIGWIALRLGLSRTHLCIALTTLMATRTVARDIVWITIGGPHIFQWILFSLAMIAVMSYCDRTGFWKLPLSLIFAWVALWTREDSMVILLLIPILQLSYVAARDPDSAAGRRLNQTITNRYFVTYYICLFTLATVTLVYRDVVVPQAVLLRSLRDAAVGLISHVRWTLLLVGDFVPERPGVQSGRFLMELLTLAWTGLLGMMASVFLLFSRPPARRRAGVGLMCMLVACSPGMALARSDLLLLPTTFFSFVIAVILIEIWEVSSLRLLTDSGPPKTALNSIFLPRPSIRSRPHYESAWVRALCVGIAVVSMAGSLYRAKLQVWDLHPMSLNQLFRDKYWIFGRASSATIPLERVSYLRAKLCAHGICSGDNADSIFQQLASAAQSSQRFAPSSERKLFVPPVDYLAP